MIKKSILLIGIVMILLLNNVNASGGGAACPYVNDRLVDYSDYVIYSYNTDTLIFRVPICSGDFGCYGIIQNTDISFKLQNIGIDLKLVNSTNQEKINIIYLRNFRQSCYDRHYNFGKVTHHEKAIAGTHWY